jgi:DNA-binding transcriptional LysR family regulator
MVMESLGALHIFVRAAELRSFTDAGRDLGLSSSAVGKAVARLEDRLGVRLFHRNTRSIALTAEGSQFLESCRRIFSEVAAIELEFAQKKAAPKGKLRVSLPLAGMVIMPVVSQFLETYPDIVLDLDFGDRPRDLIDGGFDVGICAGELDDSRLMSRNLGSYRYEMVGSPAYFARAGLPLTPFDLTSHACLRCKDPATGRVQRWPLVGSMTALAAALPTAAVASALEPLILMAERGIGIACLPDFAVQRQLADGSLVSALGRYIDYSESLRAVWPSSRFRSPKLRVFIDFLITHLTPKFAPAGTSAAIARRARVQRSDVPSLTRRNTADPFQIDLTRASA